MMLGASAPAFAADYPMRTIRYIVPQAAGGSSDTLARIVTQKLSENLGQQVVVDNRPGATGNIGGELAARAAPDGCTLIQVATSHATNPALQAKMPFDPIRDFAPVTLLSQAPNLWVVHPSLPAHNMRELIALAKSRPGQIDYASAGTGSSQHLAGELLKSLAGIAIVHIAYKGSPPALIDVLGGRVVLMCSTIAPAMPQVKTGKLRALANWGTKPHPSLPDIQPLKTMGYDMEAYLWVGVFTSAAVPEATMTKLRDLIRKAVNEPLFKQSLDNVQVVPDYRDAPEFRRFFDADHKRMAAVVKGIGKI